MTCRTRLASVADAAEMLEASGSDYTLSQTFAFGQAIARAFREYTFHPRLFEFSSGPKVLFPLIKVRRRVRFLNCFEAMPFSLNGTPIVVGGPLKRQHVLSMLGALRPDILRVNAGATSDAISQDGLDGPLKGVEHSSQILSLEGGIDTIWRSRFSAKVRNQCRLAERKGVEVATATDAADFSNYFSIYKIASARWNSQSPRYPWALFRELATLVKHGVELKIAYVKGRPIAGIVLFHGRRSTFFWGAAMLREFSSYSAHSALLRVAIEEACARGMTQFDFGASGPLESVRAFKESFGSRPVRYRNYVLTTGRYR